MDRRCVALALALAFCGCALLGERLPRAQAPAPPPRSPPRLTSTSPARSRAAGGAAAEAVDLSGAPQVDNGLAAGIGKSTDAGSVAR
jgi:hypothetical protein